ncbi:hypothetical protein MKW92_036023 [Papaver armeniacum]|nr:hypothetical protein MKW92_036023 [Papaver armeniacum]
MEYFSSSSSVLISLRNRVNSYLSEYEPILLVVTPLLALLIASTLHSFLNHIQDKGFKSVFIGLIPFVKNYIDAEKQKVVDKMQSGGKSKRDGWQTELPKVGLGGHVIDKLREEKEKDVAWQGKCSGTVYIGGNDSEGHFSLINEAYSIGGCNDSCTALEVRRRLLGGQICGNMTSGGTESILLAVKTSRDYMRTKKGITKPEMIIPESAHSAYDKAAQYFNIKLWRVPVNKEFQADVKAIRRFVNKNTILIVGSAPGFPHGIIDPIEELGELASSTGICLHVDLCLGGFFLPFARKLVWTLLYPISPLTFPLEGVTSISVDVHKYGLAPKGTSTVLYRNHEIRKSGQGALYFLNGSRPGGLKIMEVSKQVQKGIKEIPELFIMGRPDMTIVAFGSNDIDIFEVNDIMSSNGWHLNALQRPNSLHICVTLQHVSVVEDFLRVLKEAVQTGGMAPIYGAAGKMPDRGMVHDLLVDFMDSSC